MNTAELIYQKAKEIPEFEAREVLDFMERLQAKRQQRVSKGEEEKPITPEEHAAWVEQMRAITATQPMTHTTVEDMRREARY